MWDVKDSKTENTYNEVYVDRLPFHLPETDTEWAMIQKYRDGHTFKGVYFIALFVVIQIVMAIRELRIPNSVPDFRSKEIILAVFIVVMLAITIILRKKGQSNVMFITKVMIHDKTSTMRISKYKHVSYYVDVVDKENNMLVKHLPIGDIDYSFSDIGTPAYVVKNNGAYKVVV